MRKLTTALLAGFLVLAAGCMDYTEQLRLNKDGSGTLKMRVAMDKETMKTAEAMAEEIARSFPGAQEPANPWMQMNENDIRSRLKERGSKAKLERFKKSVQGTDEVTEIEFSFTSPDDFVDIAYALDDDANPDISGAPVSYEKGADGLWRFTHTLEGEEESGDMSGGIPSGTGDAGMGGAPPGMPEGMNPDEMSPEDMQKMMQEMMANLQEKMPELEANMAKFQTEMESQQAKIEESMKNRRIRFEVQFPGKVIESNATAIEGNKAIWEYKLDEMQKEDAVSVLGATVRH